MLVGFLADGVPQGPRCIVLVTWRLHPSLSCLAAPSCPSQSTAKQTYSVSDGNLAKLGSLRKANPHKADWTPMQLFLESQVGAWYLTLCHSKM